MVRSRRRFTDEFKREVMRLAEQRGGRVSQVARDLGLDSSVLLRWGTQMRSSAWKPTAGQPLKCTQQQEIEQLRRELAKCKTERDILKRRSDTLPRIRHEVSVYCPAPGGLVSQRALPGT